ncbi:hypothetical protein [Actinokineospora iranica]|uniref:hypothetical protein n=1 Tax=Actinokineospora iranica TaxID=1271860 RepID=UPI0015879AE9|nr:hypothetical protein [Actinokineospora iranica]
MDVVFEIDLVDGGEAERLGWQQAVVIHDVLLWCRLLWCRRNDNSASPGVSVT